MTAQQPRDVVALEAIPALGGLYLRGVAASGRHGVARGIGGLLGRGRGAVGGATVEPLSTSVPSLPPVTPVVHGVRVDADHLTTYQHLMGETASDVLPAGYVHVLGFPLAMAVMVREDFPLPLLGMVHLANSVEQRRAVRLGDTLEVRAWAQHLAPHRAGTSVELVVEVAVAGDASSEPAWRGVSTYLAKGVRLHPGLPPEGEPRPEVPTGAPTGLWTLGADVGRRYAAVSGDRNPIHLSALGAKAFGFPRAIAHGMYTASRALADVGVARGEAFRWDVAFDRPVLLPGTVSVRVVADDGPTGPGFSYVGWSKDRVHLSGRVAPLG